MTSARRTYENGEGRGEEGGGVGIGIPQDYPSCPAGKDGDS